MLLIKPKSDETNELDLALSQAKNNYKPVYKDKSSHRNKYVSVEQMVDSTKEALDTYKLSLTDGIETHVFESAEGIPQILEICTVTLTHTPTGQFRTCSAVVVPTKNDDINQAFNGGVSYKRRKLTATILGIVEEEEENNKKETTRITKPGKINENQINLLKKLLKEGNHKEKYREIIETYGALDEIPWRDFNHIIAPLK